jgi:hypothetical protein
MTLPEAISRAEEIKMKPKVIPPAQMEDIEN